MEDPCDSSSSSIDSSSYASLSSSSSSFTNRYGDLSTELSLGLGISTAEPSARDQHSGWPPIRSHHRGQLAVQCRNHAGTFFVKVYMEGIPIGRKLDLLAIGHYDELIRALRDMFKTKIFWYDVTAEKYSSETNVLTYEDKDGDWMMVGDVPWEIFLSTVKRLKITRATTDIYQ